MKIARRHIALSVFSAVGLFAGEHANAQTGPISGAVFTTALDCTVVNGNIYANKGDVYLDGGPVKPGAAGLPASMSFYVQVTDPSGGQVLGSSVNNKPPLSTTPLTTTSNGDVAGCLQLQAIVSLPDGTGTPGYKDSSNYGGEYKVWVSTVADFKNQYTKTDNFKVGSSVVPPSPTSGTITIYKFYDANADGVFNAGDTPLPGWKVDILGYGFNLTKLSLDGLTASVMYDNLPLTDAGASSETYTVREYQPLGPTLWFSTTPLPINSTTPTFLNQADRTLSPTHNNDSVTFGNLCTGGGGGLTLGYWSNKNGNKAIMSKPAAFAGLATLNLVNAAGAKFTPDISNLGAFDSWLLGATAKNMAYMLSVQYAAMYLNRNVNAASPGDFGAQLIFAGGVPVAHPLASGFATVDEVMAAANIWLGAYPVTMNGDPATANARLVQEAIKNALDRANNNLTFVQKTPCAMSF